MNGFTTIRNVGDPTLTTYALRDAINKGIVPGPRMFVAEVQISVAGGDFDPSTGMSAATWKNSSLTAAIALACRDG
jgi:imidazolonepropionase-like amidohydrolase